MGIVSIVTSVICKSLRNANKNKVCTCPRCRHAIKRYPEHIEERSVDSPLLIRCPSCGNIVHDPLAAEIALLPSKQRVHTRHFGRPIASKGEDVKISPG